MPLAQGEVIAGYTILRSLGHGGMGEVYLAQHPRLPRQDALKVLTAAVSADGEYRQRFQREADIAATLWHPHIVSVHDRGDFEGLLWISMEFVQGTDAARLLAERYSNGMPPDVVVRIITAVASALDHAHERGLYHRDVKPANILIANPGSPDERAMLADFGIAHQAGDASGLTGTNMTVGTVAYAAPEQLRGDHIDGRADQYALAATTYELLTGTPPFTHSNPAVVISAHLTADPPAIGTVRPELSSLGPVFDRALAKSPDKRFDRCVDFARALGHRIGSADASMDTVSSKAAVLPRHAKPVTPRRWPRVLPAVAVAVAALAAAGVFWLVQRDDTTGSAAPALPVVVVGADCATMGAAAVTTTGAPAYCAKLTDTNETIWSKYQGEFNSPSVPAGTHPDEANVRVCMEQTNQSRPDCDTAINRHNAGNS
ncbi:serine/threonine-protein kinase PknF [Mycolicibacterium doricum]|uniref:non-specific serine/threonine protein kinase n=1 Tax=Mycolicibacterium doricum TaxID=126673 RepID=A0A1X1TI10_9MYCO|nr:serine/threonine-protein kinase [Mycolicibacterium doricum]MCV7269610.1 serine/threonine protein kinase [Mycolicibacterium doricum]ORV44150.1 serine/threonine protein kinase [Mycolicibacterium doricum]BBZ09375.1 serine/threonine-protein kinase PknF [Mycolicibacterium doricum]